MIEQRYKLTTVAERLDVSLRTLQRAVEEGISTRGKRGLYPVSQIGRGCVLVAESTVERWLDDRRLQPAPGGRG